MIAISVNSYYFVFERTDPDLGVYEIMCLSRRYRHKTNVTLVQ